MRFLHPDLASWALVIPVLVACWAIHWLARAAFRSHAAIAPRFLPLSRRTSTRHDLAVLVTAMLMAGMLVVALVRPQVMLTARVPDYERQDLVIMLDRSASMSARDIAPSRFARATLELRNFVGHKPEGIGRVALVGFADTSVVLSYLTDDMESLLFYLDWVNEDPTPLLGTNIGAALDSAMDVVRRDDRATKKLFLILSDGEDYGGELARALDAARGKGYRVNCIGIGSEVAVPIPLRTPDGQRAVLLDDAGRPVLTRFSERTLRQIAGVTGGRYVRSATGDELERAIDDLAGRERTIVGWRTTTGYRDLYRPALAVAALAGAALWFLL